MVNYIIQQCIIYYGTEKTSIYEKNYKLLILLTSKIFYYFFLHEINL